MINPIALLDLVINLMQAAANACERVAARGYTTLWRGECRHASTTYFAGKYRVSDVERGF